MSSIKKVRVQNEIKLEAKINLPRSLTIKIWDFYNSKKEKKKRGRANKIYLYKIIQQENTYARIHEYVRKKIQEFHFLFNFFYVDYKMKDSYDDTYKWW